MANWKHQKEHSLKWSFLRHRNKFLLLTRHDKVEVTYRTVIFMQGGGIVRFFHHTHECYIVAKGSFAGKFASEVHMPLEDRSSQVRPTLSRSLSLDSTSDKEFYDDNGKYY